MHCRPKNVACLRKTRQYMEKHPIQTDVTAPPLLWTVSSSYACAQSQHNIKDRAGTRGKNV